MHLQPDPLFNLPTDNVGMVSIVGTPQGRLFLAGKDGCLHEIVYQAEDGWFSRKCRKVNHSTSKLSYLLPSFLSFSEADPIVQIAVDSSRQTLFTRSQRNTIQLYYMGKDGWSLSRVDYVAMDTIVHKSCVALRTGNKSLFMPLVHMSVIPASESSTLHLVAISQAGVRFYFTTTPNGVPGPPQLLALVHVRLPPGCSPSSLVQRPGNTVHQAFYRKGTLLLSSSQSDEADNLWMVDADIFPFQPVLIESQVVSPLDGHTWAVAESLEPGELESTASLSPLPPTMVTQHTQPNRRFVFLTTQGTYFVTKLRPVDQLRYLLELSQGPSTDLVQSFFTLHKETQACSMCLILATGSNQQVSSWATQAFFRYGGEPHVIFPTTSSVEQQQQQQHLADQHHHHAPPPPAFSPSFPLPPGGGGGGGSLSTSSPLSPPLPPSSSSSYPMMGAAPPSSSPVPTASLLSGGLSSGGGTPGSLGRAVLGPEFRMSGRHDGIFRYLSRLLRPVWNELLVVLCRPQGNVSQSQQFFSRFSPDAISIIFEQVCNLRSFLERNLQLLTATSDNLAVSSPTNVHQKLLQFMRPPEGMATNTPAHIQHSLINKYRADAYTREHNSLNSLYQLVVQCCECLALWKLLCEHQLHTTAQSLSENDQYQLQNTTFQSLVIGGRELISAMISSLLNRHAGDTSMTESLMAWLRDHTPSLFSHNDAIASEAAELVTMASSASKYEQINMLRESLKKYSQVTHQIDLPSVCERYRAQRYYEGIVDLCLSCAAHKDPQNLGLHFYNSGQPPSDATGQKAFLERQQAYVPIATTLGHLLAAQSQAPLSPSVPKRPGPPPSVPTNPTDEQPDPKKEFDTMLSVALRSNDKLFHITIYGWLMCNGLTDQLVEIRSPYVEEYLKSAAAGNQKENRCFLDLLWRYYEKNRNYGAAARILDQLAHKESPELSLDDRMEYLSRAVMCAKSCSVPTGASGIGEFLHELEEKMEVARIQLCVVEALRRLPKSTDTGEAIAVLNSELMDITKLYGDFAEPFDLAECKLAIIHCAGHYDPTLVESLWREIIEHELRNVGRVPRDTQMHSMRSKLVDLGQIYLRSERFFPLEYIVVLLEQCSCKFQWDVGFVHESMSLVGISLPELFHIYDHMFKSKDPYWDSVGQPLHVLCVMQSLLSSYLKAPSSVASYERAAFNTTVLDAISRYLTEVESMSPSTKKVASTMNLLRSLKTEIQRIS